MSSPPRPSPDDVRRLEMSQVDISNDPKAEPDVPSNESDGKDCDGLITRATGTSLIGGTSQWTTFDASPDLERRVSRESMNFDRLKIEIPSPVAPQVPLYFAPSTSSKSSIHYSQQQSSSMSPVFELDLGDNKTLIARQSQIGSFTLNSSPDLVKPTTSHNFGNDEADSHSIQSRIRYYTQTPAYRCARLFLRISQFLLSIIIYVLLRLMSRESLPGVKPETPIAFMFQLQYIVTIFTALSALLLFSFHVFGKNKRFIRTEFAIDAVLLGLFLSIVFLNTGTGICEGNFTLDPRNDCSRFNSSFVLECVLSGLLGIALISDALAWFREYGKRKFRLAEVCV